MTESGNIIQVLQLPTWQEAAKDKPDEAHMKSDANQIELSLESTADFPVLPCADINNKLSLFRGDITTLATDAFVNAAICSLLGGGGVDGAIHSAAGYQLLEECRTLKGCPRGQAKITGGYNLPSKHVIHTVGPVGVHPDVLSSCYRSCLSFVDSHHIRTLALCGISTGIYGYPVQLAAHIALSEVRKWLDVPENRKKVDRIIFVTFASVETLVYQLLTHTYFPYDLQPAAAAVATATTTVPASTVVASASEGKKKKKKKNKKGNHKKPVFKSSPNTTKK